MSLETGACLLTGAKSQHHAARHFMLRQTASQHFFWLTKFRLEFVLEFFQYAPFVLEFFQYECFSPSQIPAFSSLPPPPPTLRHLHHHPPPGPPPPPPNLLLAAHSLRHEERVVILQHLPAPRHHIKTKGGTPRRRSRVRSKRGGVVEGAGVGGGRDSCRLVSLDVELRVDLAW